MPLSTDVVIPLIVGLSGGAGGAYLTASHRVRHEEKTRRLDAADELSTATIRALQLLTDVARTVLKLEEDGERFDPATGDPTPALAAEIVRASTTIDDVHARIARIVLLFGDASWPARWANELVLTMRAYARHFDDWPVPLDDKALTTTFEDAHAAHQEFNRASHSEISQTFIRRRMTRRKYRRHAETPHSDRLEQVLQRPASSAQVRQLRWGRRPPPGEGIAEASTYSDDQREP